MDTRNNIGTVGYRIFFVVRAEANVRHLYDKTATKQRLVKTQQAGKTRTVLLIIFRVYKSVNVTLTTYGFT